MQLITDKFSVPTPNATYLRREKLLNALGNSVKNNLSTLIIGRTGTGKSALVADFAKEVCERRVAWLKAEASDSEWPVFFEYLVAGVKKQRPSFNSENLLKLATNQTTAADASNMAEAFINELLESGNESLLIVIDDLHYIYDSEWAMPFFNRLLPFLPSEVHFILIGRSLPPAPLWRMRSKQTLSVIDEEMLALAPEEAMTLFVKHGLSATEGFLANESLHGRISDVTAVANLCSKNTDNEDRIMYLLSLNRNEKAHTAKARGEY